MKSRLAFFGFKPQSSSSETVPNSKAPHPPAPTLVPPVSTSAQPTPPSPPPLPASNPTPSTSKTKPTPARDKLSEEINALKDNILGYQAVPSPSPTIRSLLIKDRKTLKEKEQKLKTLIGAGDRNKKSYQKKAQTLKRVAEFLPGETALHRYAYPKVGRPTVEETQPGIIETLKEIVQVNLAGADEKSRSEVIKTVKTIDHLKEEVEKLGFEISRSGLYYQLLPRDATTFEGKRHHSLLKVIKGYKYKYCRSGFFSRGCYLLHSRFRKKDRENNHLANSLTI